jgi:hypothetical protein
MGAHQHIARILEKFQGAIKPPKEFITFMGISHQPPEWQRAAWDLTQEHQRMVSQKEVDEFLESTSTQQPETTGISCHVCINTSFEAVHQHRSPPQAFGFLKLPHMARFDVMVSTDHQLEPIALRYAVDEFIQTKILDAETESIPPLNSIALAIMREFDAIYVSISENGRDGYILTRKPKREF